MKLRFIRTMWRYLLSLAEKYTPMKFSDDSVEDTLNYLLINDRIGSSGQPTENQFYAIRDAGYKTVINLLPQGTENSLKGERTLVTALGMRYIYIPVAPFNPTRDDFDKFVAAMQSASGGKVWIHCAVNARASVFIYKYRCAVIGEDEQSALWDLRQIWEPFGVWKKFISLR